MQISKIERAGDDLKFKTFYFLKMVKISKNKPGKQNFKIDRHIQLGLPEPNLQPVTRFQTKSTSTSDLNVLISKSTSVSDFTKNCEPNEPMTPGFENVIEIQDSLSGNNFERSEHKKTPDYDAEFRFRRAELPARETSSEICVPRSSTFVDNLDFENFNLGVSLGRGRGRALPISGNLA